MAMKKDIRDKIVAQALNEIEHARWHKRERIADWHKNEDIFLEKKRISDPSFSSADVHLHKSRGFVNTILSKIDTPLTFKYLASHPGDFKAAKLANAMVEADSETDSWDIKDLLGKHQGVVYGRSILTYRPSSDDGYKSDLQNVDVYDFLIDPSSGGLDIDKARYCGHYNVILHRKELMEGKKAKRFMRDEVNSMLTGSGNNTEITQEETDKDNRYLQFRSKSVNRENYDPDLFKFWNWYTTFEGERYYLLLSETHGQAIRIQKLEEITDSNMWPYWSWACFPDMSEFWTYSFMDVAREIIMVQNVSINQMLDNATKINNPQRAIDVTSVINPAELRYKKNGIIRMKAGVDINAAFRELETPAINTPLDVYEVMEGILQTMSGVTGAIQGVAEEEKVGIYEGNLAAASDRFNLLNKSYSAGYKRFAKLYMWGIKEHLNQEVSVRIMGPNGVEVENVSNTDIDPFQDFQVSVAASTAETEADRRAQRTKVELLTKYQGSGVINDASAFEMEAEIVGFDPQDIRRLKDLENTINNESIANAYVDIEAIINGKEVRPRYGADFSYVETISEYMKMKRESLSEDQFNDLADFVTRAMTNVQRNALENVADQLSQAGQESSLGDALNLVAPPEEGLGIENEGQPIQDVPLQDAPVDELGAAEEFNNIALQQEL